MKVWSIFGLILTFFCSVSDVLGCDWRRKFFKNGMVLLFCSRDSSFLQNYVYRHDNCRFLVLKRNTQDIAAGFALFAVVETSRFIG